MIEMNVDAQEGLAIVKSIKALAEQHPGGHDLRLVMLTSVGVRRLTLGPDWRYSGEPACMAALAEFGTEPPRWVAN